MANGKKGILVYADWIDKFEELTDEEAGKLIKHFFRYVNDLNPEAPDRTTKLMFIDIKNTLKRDLNKYEDKKEERSISGRTGNLKRYHLDLYERLSKGELTLENAEKLAKGRKGSLSDKDVAKLAVNESGSVSDSDINTNVFTKKEFLSDWNTLRLEHLKKQSFVNTLSIDDENKLRKLSKDYSRDDIQFALIGLFKQKKMPNGNTSMQSNPEHFLKYFNSYLTAYHDKNESLYGKVTA